MIVHWRRFYILFSNNMIQLNKIDKDWMLVLNIDHVYFIMMMMIFKPYIECCRRYKIFILVKLSILKWQRRKPFGKQKKCIKGICRRQVNQQKKGVMILLCVIIDKINYYMKLALFLILITQSLAINYSIRGQSNLLDLT